MKKFLCPNCKKDLREVGIYNIQEGTMDYHCEILNDKGEIGNWESNEFEARDAGDFYCEECNHELDLEKLGLIL